MRPLPSLQTNPTTGSNNVIYNSRYYLKSFIAQYNNKKFLTEEDNKVLQKTLDILDMCSYQDREKYLNK